MAGILLGSFAVNLTTAGSIVSSIGIASGNTLEAVLGAYLVFKFANGRNVFNRAEDIFKFFLLDCLAATMVGASAGTASLALTGFGRGVPWGSIWLTWWLGDMAGAILLAPCLVLWFSQSGGAETRRQVLLQSTALLSLLLVSILVFGAVLSPVAQGYPLKFICIPFVVWVAAESPPRETALAVLAFSMLAIGSVLHSAHRGLTPNESLLVIQLFLTVVAITSLLVSVAVSERNRHQETLQRAKLQLEERVLERTHELQERIERQERAEHALRGLSWRLLHAQDQERRRIARDLHDSTGQSLAALAMILSNISKKAEADQDLARQLDESQKITQSVLNDIRTSSYLLHPPFLDEMGLHAGLRWYVQGFQERSGLKVELNIAETFEQLPAELSLMIFRVVQECLTNIHRHSGSPSATICLSKSNATLCLEIRDCGKGIAVDKLAAITGTGLGGVGLRGMRERVKAFRGELEIFTDKQGTTVRATIPFESSPSFVGM